MLGKTSLNAGMVIPPLLYQIHGLPVLLNRRSQKFAADHYLNLGCWEVNSA